MWDWETVGIFPVLDEVFLTVGLKVTETFIISIRYRLSITGPEDYPSGLFASQRVQ